MSDNHDDSGKTGAFFLGMLVGMLLAGGAAGTFFVTQNRYLMKRADEARMEEAVAREEAELARMAAEAAKLKAKE